MGLITARTRVAIDQVIIPCTCGRVRKHDRADLAVLIEEDGLSYRGNVTQVGMKSKSSKVVCMREGCTGCWRSASAFIKKLPRIYAKEYMQSKLAPKLV